MLDGLQVRRPPLQRRAVSRPPRPTLQIWLALGCVAFLAFVVVVQVSHLGDLLSTDQSAFLTAGFARGLVLAYVLAVGVIGAWAVFAPARRLPVAVAAAGALAGVVLLGTLTLGGQVLSLVTALLALCACWQVGSWLLRAVGLPSLAELAPAAWLAGVIPIGFFVYILGRAGALQWWDVAVPILAVGALGAWRLGSHLADGSAARAWDHVRASRLAVAVAALGLLTFGLAGVWTAAPEVMFDALYAKAWLPLDWARAGDIGPLTLHPVLNGLGFTQLLAVPGAQLNAGAVGRYLQLLALPAVVATVWWSGRRSGWAPLAAAVLIVTPHLFWQSTTAYDDVLLMLGVAALALVVLRLTRAEAPRGFVAGLVVGLLAAACFDLKAHVLVLAGVMAAAWWAFQRRFELRALAGLVVGAFVGAAPPLIMRWIDSGNPLLPAYNNIFHSPYWPPVNEQFNFPYLHHPGALGPLSALARSVTDTGALDEATPIGAFGLLVGAVVIAMALGWARTRDGRRPALVLWIAVVAAFLAWYAQFRYLRYLLPAATVSLIALLLLAPAGRLRPRVSIGAVVGTVALVALLWPVAVAEFWNVPGRDIPVEAAFGFRNADDYEKASMPERDALAAYNRVAPPGTLAVSDPYQRVWLTGGRDLEPSWELTARLKTKGPLPTTPAQMLARYRQLGVTWVIVQNGGALADDKQVAALVDRYGQLEYRDATASVYRLTPTPVRPAAFAAAAGAPLTVPVCTGEVVVAAVHADGGSTPVTAAITFDGNNHLARTPTVQVAPGTSGAVAGPAPPGATHATITSPPPAGATVRRTVGHLGSCTR
jgi:hypothetical protein